MNTARQPVMFSERQFALPPFTPEPPGLRSADACDRAAFALRHWRCGAGGFRVGGFTPEHIVEAAKRQIAKHAA